MLDNMIYIALGGAAIGLIFAVIAFFSDRKPKEQKEKHA